MKQAPTVGAMVFPEQTGIVMSTPFSTLIISRSSATIRISQFGLVCREQLLSRTFNSAGQIWPDMTSSKALAFLQKVTDKTCY
jgi:hypothetical protein